MKAACWAGWTSAPAALMWTVVAHFGAAEAGSDVPIYKISAEDDGEIHKWLVTLKEDTTDAELRFVGQQFGTGQQSHPDNGEMPFVAVSMTETALNAQLAKYKDRVKFVEEDTLTKMIPDVKPIGAGMVSVGQRTYPWGLQYLEADHARGRGAGVFVYVLDTGIRISHNEFGGRAIAGVDLTGSWPATVVECNPTDTSCAPDVQGHAG